MSSARVRVRIQFSRDVDPKSIRDRVRGELRPVGRAAGAAPLPKPPAFTVTYNDAAHAIEISFAEPLERFQQVRVEVLEGITALDGQMVKPWTLTFTTGGNVKTMNDERLNAVWSWRRSRAPPSACPTVAGCHG